MSEHPYPAFVGNLTRMVSAAPQVDSIADAGISRRLRRCRLGLALFACGISMLFVGLSSAYIVRRGVPTYESGARVYSATWEPLQLPSGLLLVNTLLLAAAAMAMEAARRRSKLGNSRPLTGLSSALLFALGFMAGDFAVWDRLRSSGAVISSGAHTAFFYVLSGTHATCVVMAIIAIAWVTVGSAAWPPIRRYVAVDLASWYLHFVTALWIYLIVFVSVA